MKKLLFLLPALGLLACGSAGESTVNSSEKDSVANESQGPYLLCVRNADYEPAFINEKGDTVIPFGRYAEAFTDTIRTFGSVYDTAAGFIGIDMSGKTLFEIYQFDNGPDYVEDGLFRIIKDGKIGYANELGDVVIEPQFSCAHPFENGQAKVALNC